MLRDREAADSLEQGDVIANVPFLVTPKRMQVKAAGVQGQSRLDCARPDTYQQVKEHADGADLSASQIPLEFKPGVVLTQSCDLLRKHGVSIAPLYPLRELVDYIRRAEDSGENLVILDQVRTLTEGQDHTHLIYFGDAVRTGKRMAADLLGVRSFLRDWQEYFVHHRICGTTDEGLKYVQGRLTTLSGRFATSDGFWHQPIDNREDLEKLHDTQLIDAAYAALAETESTTQEAS